MRAHSEDALANTPTGDIGKGYAFIIGIKKRPPAKVVLGTNPQSVTL